MRFFFSTKNSIIICYYVNGDFMKKGNKYLITILISIIIGVLCAKYIFSEYEKETKDVFSEDNYVYIYQYGAYKDKNTMEEACDELEGYFYYKDDLYHVILGVSLSNNIEEKIKSANNVDSDLYIKKEKIDNSEFLENLKQYDNLINTTDDKNTIINAERQILSKYNELILQSE